MNDMNHSDQEICIDNDFTRLNVLYVIIQRLQLISLMMSIMQITHGGIW